jgi:hypothetical protein
MDCSEESRCNSAHVKGGGRLGVGLWIGSMKRCGSSYTPKQRKHSFKHSFFDIFGARGEHDEE